MDSFTVATLLVVCLAFYRMINFAVKVLKTLLFSDYPSNAEELPSLPFIGHAYLVIGSTDAILSRILELGKMYPTSFPFALGHYSFFLITCPEHMKEVILSPKTIEKSFFYKFGRSWGGNGLVTAPASLWKVHRKLLQPSFNSMALKSFVGTFATQSVILAQKMEQHLDGLEFEIYRYVSLCTLDAICATAMGINMKAQESGCCQYGEAVRKVLFGFAKRTVRPWLYPDSIFYRTQLGKDERKHIEFIYNVGDNVIRQQKAKIVRRSDQRVSANNEQDSFDNAAAGPQTLVENLLRQSIDNKTLTDKDTRDHVHTVIGAASDTTAITLNYLMLMLASHQDIQDKVYQELCDIFGEHVSDDDSEEVHFTMEALTRMTYMERVIKETMRLFPAVPVIGRKATDDFDLGQRTLPRETEFLLNILGVHRSEKYWPDPLKFDPDRFLPERLARQQPYSYLPFLGGRRNCIGSKYAMMSMKTIVATVLRKYVLIKDKVIPIKDIRLAFDILLRSVDPVTLRIRRRVK
ncbi:cytochrome P450 4C1-like [Diprion similis]|uniref:cytochrome P450 4C1-like n=1 Tax=Diprion similis TaxID=362088 RepID=UPI001EF8D005|nr:cytochrome P450 4C1-like [Diprion similis]